mmetsp:Transcript_60098/g.170417  ORF Transcript_60098/g.170417 Transcript_60098/m.170417 type:complete len:105 (-) Transcript_60098:1452-1766(-)
MKARALQVSEAKADSTPHSAAAPLWSLAKTSNRMPLQLPPLPRLRQPVLQLPRPFRRSQWQAVQRPLNRQRLAAVVQWSSPPARHYQRWGWGCSVETASSDVPR